jgi:hypothetical protein
VFFTHVRIPAVDVPWTSDVTDFRRWHHVANIEGIVTQSMSHGEALE